MEYLHIPGNDYFLDDLDEQIEHLEDEIGSILSMWNEALANIDTQYDQFCLLAALTTTRMQAQSDRLEYFYDYGDGWKVDITISDVFYESDLVMDKETDLYKVLRNYTPMCLEADGLPVVDDVGGIGGYIEFLSRIHDDEEDDERNNAREWARSLGWTGRLIKPKNML